MQLGESFGVSTVLAPEMLIFSVLYLRSLQVGNLTLNPSSADEDSYFLSWLLPGRRLSSNPLAVPCLIFPAT